MQEVITPKKRKCAFCSNDAITLTREHLWSAWIGERVKAKGYNFRHYTDAGTIKHWRQQKLDQSARVVCGDCNNGWMSQLEAVVKTGFADVIATGVPVSLLSSGLALLAAYAFKGAVIADQLSPNEDGTFFYTSNVRHKFRISGTIPKGVQMWLFAFKGLHRSSGIFEGHYLKAPISEGSIDDVRFHVFTFLAGRLGFQVMASKWADVRRSGHELPSVTQPEAWEPAAPQFWPLSGEPLKFPPPKYLTNATLKPFTQRFVGPATLTY